VQIELLPMDGAPGNVQALPIGIGGNIMVLNHFDLEGTQKYEEEVLQEHDGG
jgi:hypothetical protein